MARRSGHKENRRKKDPAQGRRVRYRVLAALTLGVVLAGGALGLRQVLPETSRRLDRLMNRLLPVRRVVIEGSHRLSRDELVERLPLPGRNMLSFDLSAAREALVAYPWIRHARLRKEFPATLRIAVTERRPVALLHRKNRFFYLDRDGRLIERVRAREVPFLPVLTHAPDGAVPEAAMELVGVLYDRKVVARSEAIELSLRDPRCIVMQIDGLLVRVGHEGFAEKIDRWLDIEPEVRRRGISVDTVDLRFADRVIVKPLREGDARG